MLRSFSFLSMVAALALAGCTTESGDKCRDIWISETPDLNTIANGELTLRGDNLVRFQTFASFSRIPFYADTFTIVVRYADFSTSGVGGQFSVGLGPPNGPGGGGAGIGWPDTTTLWTLVSSTTTYIETIQAIDTPREPLDASGVITLRRDLSRILTVTHETGEKTVTHSGALPGDTLWFNMTLSNSNVVPLTGTTSVRILSIEGHPAVADEFDCDSRR